MGVVWQAVHVVALALWLGSVVSAGLGAAIIFPTMRGLDPRLPGYGGYTGEHWMLAAGKIAARIFAATDVAQVVAALVAAVSAVGLVRSGWVRARSVAGGGWVLGLVGAVGVLAYSTGVLRRRMDANLLEYWAAALAGENEAAEAARLAFGAEHPLASNLMAGTALLVLAALVCGVLAAGNGKRGAERQPGSVRPGTMAGRMRAR